MQNPSETDRAFSQVRDFDPMPFEIDFTGYMGNTVVVRWMERLRVQMMRRYFSEIDTGSWKHLSVVTRTEINYANTIRYGELIRGTAWVEDIGRARWRVGFAFQNTFQRNLAISAR